MTLATIFTHLAQRAAATGRDQAANLHHGARIAVRVRDGVTTLTLARRGAPVGAGEIVTFRAHCGVPEAAVRIPEEGQRTREDADGATWHYLAYRWPAEADAQPGEEAAVAQTTEEL